MSGFVYFITFEGGPIKIGKALDVKKRLSALQTSSPETLFVLGAISGGSEMEASLHKQFSHLRLRGEWFRRESELLSFIEESRDISLWPESVPILKLERIDGDSTNFGPVQAIAGEWKGQYGYWDDNEDDEAIVYFESVNDGPVLVPHDELRRLDDEIESQRCQAVSVAFFPRVPA